MSSLKAAMFAFERAHEMEEKALALLRSATDEPDTEPAPVSIVLVRDRSSGRVHRRFRVEGIAGLASYESDNADQAGVFDIIPDLSTVSDEAELCDRCFGSLDGPPDTDEVPA